MSTSPVTLAFAVESAAPAAAPESSPSPRDSPDREATSRTSIEGAPSAPAPRASKAYDPMPTGGAAAPAASLVTAKAAEPARDFNRRDSEHNSDEQASNGDGTGQATGRWSEEEHKRFSEAFEQFGPDWKRIADHVVTRSNIQVRTHAQKYMVQSKAAVDDSVMRAAFAHPFLQRPAYGVPNILPNVSAYQQPHGLLGKAAQARTLSPSSAYYPAVQPNTAANAGAGWQSMVQGAYPAQWAIGAAASLQSTMLPMNYHPSIGAFYAGAPTAPQAPVIPSVDNDAARWASELGQLSTAAKSIHAPAAVASTAALPPPSSSLKRTALEPEPKVVKRQIKA